MRYSLRYLVAATALVVAGTAIAIQTQSKVTEERTYVGQQTCMTSGCHAGAYEGGASYKGAEAFRETMHQKIHHRPTPENVVIDRLFREGKELKYWDNRIRKAGRDTLIVKLSKGEQENDYYIQLKFSNGGDSLPKMKVAYNYGGNGWLQRYLVELEGNYYVAPFQYVLPSYRSTSDTGIFYFLDLNRWYKIDANRENGVVFFDWHSNEFRAQSWDKNCAACHVNGFDVYKVASGENNADTAWYATWAGVEEGDSAKIDDNISIGCESCHGPGSEHSANPSKTNILSPKQLEKTREATDIKLDMCNQCHKRLVSLKGEHAFGYDETNRIPYIVGTRLKDFTKPGPRVWADGTVSNAHHQQGDDYEHSIQYKEHLFVEGCSDCHLSHFNSDQPFQLNQDWYTLEDGKGCMSCHGSPGKSAFPADNLGEVVTIDGKEINKHSRHAQSQSACVNCHYTTSNTIAFTGTLEFTDHSFRVFRPKGTLDYYKQGGKNPFIGMINTCASECHRNGRGARNDQPGDPEAPYWGIVDRDIYSYKEASDSALAELLWMHYQEMYKDIMKPSGVGPGETRKALNGKLTLVTPNPFVTAARIDFSVAKAAPVKVEIYSVDGKHVKTLADRSYTAGNQTVLWEGDDEQGMPVLSGSYFVRLSSDGVSDSRRIVLAR